VRPDANSVLIHHRSPGPAPASVGRPLAVGATPRSATNCHCCVLSASTAAGTADPEGNKPGRDLGYTRYDIMAQGLGCYGEYVEQPEDIRPALERAQKKVDDGMVALVNVT
jgi:hypothetical protein